MGEQGFIQTERGSVDEDCARVEMRKRKRERWMSSGACAGVFKACGPQRAVERPRAELHTPSLLQWSSFQFLHYQRGELLCAVFCSPSCCF